MKKLYKNIKQNRSEVSVVTSFIKSIATQMNIPRHLLTIDDAEILKNVVLHSVATAFASMVCKIRGHHGYKITKKKGDLIRVLND